MQEIIDKIYERMQFCADAQASTQEEEHHFILELACLNEVLDQIEGFPWNHYEQAN